MGRVKEQLLIDEEQEELIRQQSGKVSVMYNDLFDMNELDNPSLSHIVIVQSIGHTQKVHYIPVDKIVYISGLCIRYTYVADDVNVKRIVSIPFDKVSYISLEYTSDEE